jgi:hypothetical protein
MRIAGRQPGPKTQLDPLGHRRRAMNLPSAHGHLTARDSDSVTALSQSPPSGHAPRCAIRRSGLPRFAGQPSSVAGKKLPRTALTAPSRTPALLQRSRPNTPDGRFGGPSCPNFLLGLAGEINRRSYLPGIEVDHVVRGREVQARAARLERAQEDIAVAGLKRVDLPPPFGSGGAAIEVADVQAEALEVFSHEPQERRELAEHERSVTCRRQGRQEPFERVELGARERATRVE